MLRRTLEGDPLAQDSAGGLSVWEFLGDARTAESGIHGAATAIGTAIGRMHELLSRHPASRPRLRPAHDVIDLPAALDRCDQLLGTYRDRKSTRLNSSHVASSYAVFCLKKKNLDL